MSVVRSKKRAQAVDVPALVRAAQAGDRSAFGQLYVRYAGMVHAIAFSGVAVDDAGDIVQEVFLRALRRLKSLHEPEAYGAWIAAIARNAVNDLRSLDRAST